MIIPFKVKTETLLCGQCHDDEGLFHIDQNLVAFCVNCGCTVILKSSTYPDWRELDDNQ